MVCIALMKFSVVFYAICPIAWFAAIIAILAKLLSGTERYMRLTGSRAPQLQLVKHTTEYIAYESSEKLKLTNPHRGLRGVLKK
jgi:hypothetical protein